MTAAIVLASRGFVDPEQAREFLDCSGDVPDPFLLAHMEAAIGALDDALRRGRRVVIHGDYDADGITATALMVSALRDLGGCVEWYLPSRFREGYGLSRSAVEAIAAGGDALLVTVDCGVNYPDEVALAKQLGLDVIVVDHHQPGPVMPDCAVIHAAVGSYPHHMLCGVGLALKVMHAFYALHRGSRRDRLPEQLKGFLDLVAIGTVADLASLQGENRYYVKEGVKALNLGSRAGLRALAAVAKCTGNIDAGTIGFRIAPRLNAAGRMADASPPLQLLLTEDYEEAEKIAVLLHDLNGERQDVERRIFDEAVGLVESLESLPYAIVLAREGWHEGVVGIVCSRLVDRYRRPVVLLSLKEGLARGSGRSIPAYDLFEALRTCASHLIIYGGHAQAAGLTLDVKAVEGFGRAFVAHAESALTPADFAASYRADAIIRGEDVSVDTALALESLGPFGCGNPRPRLLAVGATICQPEATRDGSHLRCGVEVDGVRVRGVGFGMGNKKDCLSESESLMLGVQMRVNEWQGNVRTELVLEQIGSAPSADSGVHCGPACLVQPGAEFGRSEAVCAPVRGPECDTVDLGQLARNDLRNHPGRAGALGQVMASGETVAVLATSIPHLMSRPIEGLALRGLAGAEFACLGGICGRGAEGGFRPRVTVAAWDIAPAFLDHLAGVRHIIAADPPWRRRHVTFLADAVEAGVTLHLCYGEEERTQNTSLLRYLVHPRFAMVCLFRARQQGREDDYRRALELGWQERGVLLSESDLSRADLLLRLVGKESSASSRDRIETRLVPEYAAAVAEYEECARLCLTL